MLLGGISWPLASPADESKGRNASKDGFVNLYISLKSLAPFGSLAPPALALLFCFSLIRRSLSGSQLGVLVPPGGARMDFLGCELFFSDY